MWNDLWKWDSKQEKQDFERIYQENYLLLYHIAFGILKRQAQAEDAVSETFVSLAENFKKYFKNSCSDMTGLCVIIVKHKALDILRKERHLSEKELESLVLYEEAPERLPEELAQQRERSRLVNNALEQLPEVLKETLVLKYYYEYNNLEIAKILNVSLKTVEMRLYRGKRKLREMLDEGMWQGRRNKKISARHARI